MALSAFSGKPGCCYPLKPASMNTRLYGWVRMFLRLVVGIFFRQIEVVGLEHVPAAGPVIFAGNHPNSVIDPMLIVVSCGRVVQFAAKDVLFHSRLFAPLLKALGAVPIARRSDHVDEREASTRNAVAFDALFAILAGGGAVGIFPEGVSHDAPQLARLKTGAARIAIGLCELHPDLRIHIVPCGLTYVQRRRFRSRVLLQFGPPLAIDSQRARADDAVRAITTEIERSLRALTINAEDWDTLRVLDGIRRLYQPPAISLEERVELARRFSAEYPRVKDQHEIQVLFSRVAAYLDRLSAEGLSDHALRSDLPPEQTAGRVARHLLLLMVWLPLALPGIIIHAPAGLLVQFAAPLLTPRKDALAATKLLAGVLIVLVFYAAGILSLGWYLGVPAALVAILALPITGYATLQLLDRGTSLRRAIPTLMRLRSPRHELDSLRTERAELEHAVVRAVNRFRPAEMILLFPRDAESIPP
jgi:glycerol-3-phosphate O-acyltransferase/dihydroxyacetone phosphate acyltransferase